MNKNNDFLLYDALDIIEDNYMTIILNLSAGHCK